MTGPEVVDAGWPPPAWPPRRLLDLEVAQELIFNRVPPMPTGVDAHVRREHADWVLVIENARLLEVGTLNEIRASVAPLLVRFAPFGLPGYDGEDVPRNVPAHCGICGSSVGEDAVFYDGALSNADHTLGYPAWVPSPDHFTLCGDCDVFVAAGDRAGALDRAGRRLAADAAAVVVAEACDSHRLGRCDQDQRIGCEDSLLWD